MHLIPVPESNILDAEVSYRFSQFAEEVQIELLMNIKAAKTYQAFVTGRVSSRSGELQHRTGEYAADPFGRFGFTGNYIDPDFCGQSI